VADRSSGSAVVRRRLGRALRQLREDANIRIERAARELECSTAKISRLENGLGPAKTVEVRALLDLYGLHDPDRRARFERWAAQTKSSGWWEADSDLTTENLARTLAVETEAVGIRTYCTPVFPTVLQTPEYALAHVRAWAPELSRSDAERMVDMRLARQAAVLGRETELRYDAVIDEGAVRRQVGSPKILADQLGWLADLLDRREAEGRDDISVRVLPFTAGVPGRALSSFAIFTPRDVEFDPIVAICESTGGEVWYETSDEIEPLAALFDQLKARALPPRASREVLRRA
jgi:transcriptional regulator with XRE-family HTH domain